METSLLLTYLWCVLRNHCCSLCWSSARKCHVSRPIAWANSMCSDKEVIPSRMQAWCTSSRTAFLLLAPAPLQFCIAFLLPMCAEFSRHEQKGTQFTLWCDAVQRIHIARLSRIRFDVECQAPSPRWLRRTARMPRTRGRALGGVARWVATATSDISGAGTLDSSTCSNVSDTVTQVTNYKRSSSKVFEKNEFH